MAQLDARTSRGESVKVSYAKADKGTVLYHFSPGCGWCVRNAPNFKALRDQISARYQVVSYTETTAGLDKFVASTTDPGVVLTDGRTSIRRSLKLRGTPETIVLDRNGTVVRSWEGAYSGDRQKELEQFFGVHLPGLKN